MNVLRGGRADPTEEVGARSRERATAAFDQRPRNRVVGATNAHGLHAARDQIGNALGPAENEGQRSRPERLRELPCALARLGDLPRLLDVRDMNDQRIEARTPLGREDPRDGAIVGRVGGESIDGLRRHSDQLAVADRVDGGEKIFVHTRTPCSCGSALGEESPTRGSTPPIPCFRSTSPAEACWRALRRSPRGRFQLANDRRSRR